MARKHLSMNYKVQLDGLHCDACKKIIQKRLGKLEGVTLITVELDAQTALIQSNNPINQIQIENALKDSEYKIIGLVEA